MLPGSKVKWATLSNVCGALFRGSGLAFTRSGVSGPLLVKVKQITGLGPRHYPQNTIPVVLGGYHHRSFISFDSFPGLVGVL